MLVLRKTQQRGARVRLVLDLTHYHVSKKGEEGKEGGATGESGTRRRAVFVEKGWFQKKPGVNEMGRQQQPLVLVSGGAAARARG